MTRVVNLYKEPYDVYIGRAGKGREGPLGNPVAIGMQCPVCEGVHNDAGATLPCCKFVLEKNRAIAIRYSFPKSNEVLKHFPDIDALLDLFF